MKKKLVPFLVLTLAGCTPSPPWDTRPPQLVGTQVTDDGRELDLEFDEPLASARTEGTYSAAPAGPELAGSTVKLPLPPGLTPGKSYEWSAEVRDPGQNLTSLRGRFFGPNLDPVSLRLNEVRVAGSASHPDLVELLATEPGNLGGWTVESWSGPDSRVRFVLPDLEVTRGALVVVHWKPAGTSQENDETESPGTSKGADASPEAYDFWVPGGKGLPGTKGLVVLRSKPEAPPFDGLLYSQKPGEGAPLAEAAGWEDRTEWNPAGCTATRTWCRTAGPDFQWVLVATGASTPGKPNRIIPWEGPTANQKRVPKTKE